MAHLPQGGEVPGGWPTSVSEAVDRLIAALAPEQLEVIRGWGELELSAAHFGLGLWVRNNFGLWAGNRALLESCLMTEHGSVPPAYFPLDADGPSQVILRALRDRLAKAATGSDSMGARVAEAGPG
jgi:hypothetical protein